MIRYLLYFQFTVKARITFIQLITFIYSNGEFTYRKIGLALSSFGFAALIGFFTFKSAPEDHLVKKFKSNATLRLLLGGAVITSTIFGLKLPLLTGLIFLWGLFLSRYQIWVRVI